MPRSHNELVDLGPEYKLKHETERAWLIGDSDPDNDCWIPKTVGERNSDGTFTVPHWFALDKELI